jgi:hypothetical protein
MDKIIKQAAGAASNIAGKAADTAKAAVDAVKKA